jgi:4'-phosphopantetheinyl transferase
MPVGIDIEKIHPIPLEDFEPYFSEMEWKKIVHSSNALHTFYSLWCRKEALSKVHGEGVSLLQQKLDVQRSPLTYRNSNYYFNNLHVHPDYCCALCAPVSNEIHLQHITL